jgi:hypothetical protein
MTSIEDGFQYNEQAHAIGFQDGDIPVSADGKEIKEFSLGPVMRTISNAATVTVLRQGEEVVLQMPEEGLSMLKMLQAQIASSANNAELTMKLMAEYKDASQLRNAIAKQLGSNILL